MAPAAPAAPTAPAAPAAPAALGASPARRAASVTMSDQNQTPLSWPLAPELSPLSRPGPPGMGMAARPNPNHGGARGLVGILPIATRSAATAFAGAGLPLKGQATDAVSSRTLHQCRPSPVAATWVGLGLGLG